MAKRKQITVTAKGVEADTLRVPGVRVVHEIEAVEGLYVLDVDPEACDDVLTKLRALGAEAEVAPVRRISPRP